MKAHQFIVSVILVCVLAGGAKAQCDCQGQWDLNYNGIQFEIGDAVVMYNVMFSGFDPLYAPPCACGLGDVDCSGVMDVADLVKLVRVITGDLQPQYFCHADSSCSVAACTPSAPVIIGNDVYVESKTVLPGSSGVTLGVYLLNDHDVTSIMLPLEFRPLTPGSYIAGTLALNVGGRLAATGMGSANTFSAKTYDDSPGVINSCSGPVSSTYDSAVYMNLPAIASPMGAMFVGFGFGPSPASPNDLPAGFDGYPGNGSPSLLLTFDVTSTPGQFEIDSCCWAPANHLAFVASDMETVILPHFTKGVVTIGNPPPPDCHCHADPRCDGVTDIIDVIGVISSAFRGTPATLDLTCGVGREDVDCSGVVDLIDVIRMINVVARGGNPATQFCTP